MPLTVVGAFRSLFFRRLVRGASATMVVVAPMASHAADRLRLHAGGGVSLPLGGYQSRELGPGGFAEGSVEWAFSSQWGLEVRAAFDVLSKGSGTPPPRVAPLDTATASALGVGLRGRPLGPPRLGFSLGGLWLGAGVGGALTTGSLVPVLDGQFGYEVFVSERWGIGPLVGYSHYFDTTSGPRDGDAGILHAGLGLTYEFVGQVAPRAPDDSDRDGIFDKHDRCVAIPEDRDDFEDLDGCPESDNDQDGIADAEDHCPHDPEDVDQFEDVDGCPEYDNDHDEILDVRDRCPLVAEDKDNFEDADGCPEADNDKDNIPDAKDLCPNEPETLNGFSDNDGCPDEQHVRVVGDKIELDQKIHFWSDSAKLRGMSYPVLTKLAEFLVKHPEYVSVSIEGHADERGPAELNLKLSAARAESVMKFLVEHGVEPSRVSFVGHGASKPLAEGSGEYAWFLNRRVEFIVTRNKEVVEAAPASAPELPPVPPVDGEEPRNEKGATP